MNVATTVIRPANTIMTPYSDMPSTEEVMDSAMVCRRPDELTALPNDRPPAARMMMVQRKLLKSSFVKMPVPKNRTRGMMATTPISPKMGSSWCDTHHSAMVTSVTILMNHCVPVNLSFRGRIGTISLSPTLKLKRSRVQIKRIEMMQTGSATKNHTPQEGSGDIFCSAMRF